MRRLCLILVAIMILWSVPAAILAQGFFGTGGTSGIGGPPFPFATSAARADGTGSGLTSMPTLYAGWLEHPRGATWSLQRQNSTGTAPWPLKGFWFGASKDVTFFGGLGVIASGGIFVPWRADGTWYQSPVGSSFAFEIPQYNWGNIDGLVKCSVTGPFEILAGFRWDHVSTRVNYSDNSSDDYILNSYMPLIGAQFNQRWPGGSLTFRIVGSPVVRGQMSYNFWDRLGYGESGDFPIKESLFLEILADYQVKLASDVSVGVFGKWNALQVRTDTEQLTGSTTEAVSWTVNLQSWTFGVDTAVYFVSPL
jgi:hypothetical protein